MTLNIVGKSIQRVDAYDKVTGRALYPQDLAMDGMVYAKTVRSKKPHAYIKTDFTEAEKVEGVIRIFDYKDVKNNFHGVVFKDQEVFCSKKVRRIGDPIALIVAESQKACDKAFEKVIINYEELPSVFCPKEAMKEDAPIVHEDNDSNVCYHYKIRKGDVKDAFKNAHVVVENTYTTHPVDHAFIQPEAGLAYLEEDGTVVVAVATQYPHYDREEVANALGLEQEQVKILNTNIGGAFGGREDITLQIHIALAAKELKKPIKMIFSREESFIAHSKRHGFIMKCKTAADKDGKLLALESEIIGDTGAYASWALNVLRKAGVHITGPYEIPNVKVDSYAVYTNNILSGAMRGFGAAQPPIATEQQMDIIAEKLGISPIEIRERNMFKKGSITATGQLLKESVPLDKCLYAVTDQYNKLKKDSKDSIIKRGAGIGLSFYGTGYGDGFPDVSTARVELLNDGRVGIFVGATEVGQGAKTALAQIGAEQLDLTLDDIVFISEDTSKMPDAGTAAASRQTYNTGNSIKKACKEFKDKLIEVSQKELGLNSTVNLELNNKNIYVSHFPEKRISFKELASKYTDENKLEVEASFTAQTVQMDSETGQGAPYWPYTFNAAYVEVEVNTSTGKVDLINASFAQDVGRAVNPLLIEGQMDGGFAMSLGYILFEDLNIKNGDIINNKFSKYLIPTAMDMIEVKNIIVEDPESTAPYGAKGIGEPVMIPMGPAILNAIYDAIGVRIKDLPANPERIIKEIKH